MVYIFLVQNSTSESAIFSYKTALSKSNVKKNWMESAKWNYHKECHWLLHFFGNLIWA